MSSLSPRHEAFAREYVKDRNCVRAAVRAGYAESSANAMGYWLVKRIDIAARIEELAARLIDNSDITAERVLQEYKRVAFADARRLHRPDGTLKAPHEWDDDVAAQIAGIEVTRTSTSALASGDGVGEDAVGAGVVITEQTLKVKRWDKLKALEVLAKHTGVLTAGTDRASVPAARIDPRALTDDELAELLQMSQRVLTIARDPE